MLVLPRNTRLVKSPFVSCVLFLAETLRSSKPQQSLSQERVTHKELKRERRLDKCSCQRQLKCNKLRLNNKNRTRMAHSRISPQDIINIPWSAFSVFRFCAKNAWKDSSETTRRENYIMNRYTKEANTGKQSRRLIVWSAPQRMTLDAHRLDCTHAVL